MRRALGVRGRIVFLMLPVIVLLAVGLAGMLYLSLTEVLEASADDDARSEVASLVTALIVSSDPRVLSHHPTHFDSRVEQIVAVDTGEVVDTSLATNGPALVDVARARPTIAVLHSTNLPGLPHEEYSVAMARATAADGRRYVAIVAVATRIEEATFQPSLEFAGVGAVVLIALIAGIATFVVSEAFKPVERMRDQVEALAASGPAPSIEVPPGKDEVSRLATTMNRVLAQLQSADLARRAFVADAGHELRSPLATISVLLEQLGEPRADPERSELVRQAMSEVGRLTAIVDDLRFLAASDERGIAARLVDVDLDDVVLAETTTMRSRGMPLTVRVEPVRTTGDPGRLGRMVRNLLENGERHRRSMVRVTLECNGTTTSLCVDNDGPPIRPEDRERVFERFVRLDDSRARATGGSGLGLAIVADIARSHGGTVTATDAPDGWCRFLVTLPCAGPEGGCVRR